MASTGLFNHVGTVHRVMTKANEEIKSNTQIIEAIATKVIQEKVGKPLDKLIARESPSHRGKKGIAQCLLIL